MVEGSTSVPCRVSSLYRDSLTEERGGRSLTVQKTDTSLVQCGKLWTQEVEIAPTTEFRLFRSTTIGGFGQRSPMVRFQSVNGSPAARLVLN